MYVFQSSFLAGCPVGDTFSPSGMGYPVTTHASTGLEHAWHLRDAS